MHPIKRQRAEQRLSLRELARRSGVPAGTISGIERGQREPQILTLAKIADALQVDVEELTSPKALAPPSLEWVLAVADEDLLRLRIRDASTEQLRGWVKALAGNQRTKNVADLRAREGMREAVAQMQVMHRATIIRDELLSRGEEDPKMYLPDLKRRLDALGID